jgi:eukaryotic-like serine/threonine-protein kinase
MNVIQRDEEAIFHVARRIEAREARGAYLDHVCGDDRGLRDRLDALLGLYEQEASFLESPALGPPTTLTAAGVTRPPEAPGMVIGPYKLLEPIGEGGMGVVYMAEQTQPVRRRVALKIIKPGMDTKQVIARFDAERQALALMDHPNIAKVLDAGATDSGHPYFVMELVRGIPITDYCDKARLSVRERLDLFVLVCRAVQHAHQKGIIHRDLKPSNVMVTLVDGSAVPKVIDFGVAKATGASLTERTLFTSFAQMIGTPLYMSPEQAELSGVDVDTRSDIYSLGVLLYELLTGTTPIDRDTLCKAAYDEVRRIIREQETPTPSTRLGTLGDTLATVSANRQADPRKLSHAVRGELDWIVMKALEKDRRRRYETANDFAADVTRHLTDEPVTACPPSAWYRFSKAARRHRVALVTSTLVATALVLGTAVSVWQAVRATRAERQAGTRSLLARRAVDEMYTGFAEKWLDKEPQLTLTQREFLGKALAFYQEFAADPGTDPSVRLETARAYRRVSSILSSLDHQARAEEANQRAIDLVAKLAADHPNQPDVRAEFARVHRQKALLLGKSGKASEAEQFLRRASEVYGKLVEEAPGVAEYRRGLAQVCNNLGQLLRDTRPLEAEQADRRGVELLEALVKASPDDADLQNELGCYLHNLALDLRDQQGRRSEGRQLLQRAIALQKNALKVAPRHPNYRLFLGNHVSLLVSFQVASGELREAGESLRQVLTITEGLAADFPSVPHYRHKLAVSHDQLGTYFREKCGQPREAEQEYREGLAIREKLVADFPEVLDYRIGLFGELNNLANSLADQGEHEKAEQLYLRAVKAGQELADDFPKVPSSRAALALALRNLAFFYGTNGRQPEADPIAARAIDHWEKLAAVYPDVFEYRLKLADAIDVLRFVRSDLGRPLEEIVTLFKRSVSLYEKLLVDFPEHLEVRSGLANCLRHLGQSQKESPGRFEEAEQSHRRSIAIYEKLAADFPSVPGYRSELCLTLVLRQGLLQAHGNLAESLLLARQAMKIQEKLAADYPLVPDYQSDLGNRLNDLAILLKEPGDLDEAQRLLRRAIVHQQAALKLSPKNPTIRRFLGNNYANLLNNLVRSGASPAEVARSAEDLARTRPDDLEMIGNAANGLVLASILAERDPQIEQDSRQASARTYLARAHDLIQAAERLLKEGDHQNQHLLAWLLVVCPAPRAGDPTRAVGLARKALALQPENADYWNTLGIALYRAGDDSAAIEALDKMTALRKGGHDDGDFFRAMAHQRRGERDLARSWFDKAVSWMEQNQNQDPDNELKRRHFRDEAAALLGRPTTTPPKEGAARKPEGG